jgi:hypothetical protein
LAFWSAERVEADLVAYVNATGRSFGHIEKLARDWIVAGVTPTDTGRRGVHGIITTARPRPVFRREVRT